MPVISLGGAIVGAQNDAPPPAVRGAIVGAIVGATVGRRVAGAVTGVGSKTLARSTSAPLRDGSGVDGLSGARHGALKTAAGVGRRAAVSAAGSAHPSARAPPPSTGASASSATSAASGARRGGRPSTYVPADELHRQLESRDDEIRNLRRQLEAERLLLAQRTELLLEPGNRSPEVLRQLVGSVFPPSAGAGAHTGALIGGASTSPHRYPHRTLAPKTLDTALRFGATAVPAPVAASTATPYAPTPSGGKPSGGDGLWDAEFGALPVSVVQPSAGGGFGTGGDAYLAASKACVRADGPRCGRLEAAKMLALVRRYKIVVPPDMAEAAKKKGMCSYTVFIDRLRELGAASAA